MIIIKNKNMQSSFIELYNNYHGIYSILGNEKPINKIKTWFSELAKKQNSSVVPLSLIVHGQPGTGKSHICNYFAKYHNFDTRHLYANDIRNKEFFESCFQNVSKKEIIIKNGSFEIETKTILYIFDDVDCDYLNLNYICDYIKKKEKVKIPIIFICNKLHQTKLSSLSPKYAEIIHFDVLCETHLRIIYRRINHLLNGYKSNEQGFLINHSKDDSFEKECTKIIKESNGDARYFIINYEMFYRTKKFSCEKKDIKNNLWEIYDKLSNDRNASVNELINMSLHETNWIISGIFENYTFINNQDEIQNSMKIVDYLAISNCLENSYINYDILNIYSKSISIYSYVIECNNKPLINTEKFKFPSCFSKYSNYRINCKSNNKILKKISKATVNNNCIYYKFYFKNILLNFPLSKCDKTNCNSIVNSILKVLSGYNLSVEDFYILIRSNVFGGPDLRSFVKGVSKTHLKIEYLH